MSWPCHSPAGLGRGCRRRPAYCVRRLHFLLCGARLPRAPVRSVRPPMSPGFPEPRQAARRRPSRAPPLLAPFPHAPQTACTRTFPLHFPSTRGPDKGSYRCTARSNGNPLNGSATKLPLSGPRSGIPANLARALALCRGRAARFPVPLPCPFSPPRGTPRCHSCSGPGGGIHAAVGRYLSFFEHDSAGVGLSGPCRSASPRRAPLAAKGPLIANGPRLAQPPLPPARSPPTLTSS